MQHAVSPRDISPLATESSTARPDVDEAARLYDLLAGEPQEERLTERSLTQSDSAGT